MNYNFLIAAIIQGLLVIWLLAGLRIRKEDYHFLDENSTVALKGYFSIIILFVHVPVSNVLYNLLGGVSHVMIVTLFSFFSTYGMTVKTKEDKLYVNRIPARFLRIAVLYGVILLIKHFVTGNMFSGGILWIDSLLLAYIIFYLSHLVGGKHSDHIVIAFWIAYAIVMCVWRNPYLNWPAQALGFAYGSIVAVFGETLLRFFVKRIREICVACILLLLVLVMIYLHIHTPEQENMQMYFMRVIVSFLLVLLFLTLSVRMSLVSKTMTYIGKISLYIYLLHGLVIDILKNYLADSGLILACIIMTILLAICFKWITEKIIYILKMNDTLGGS